MLLTKYRIMSNESNFLAGLVIGAVAGAVAGLLAAPYSGKETREIIASKAGDMGDDLEKQYKKISKKIKGLEKDSIDDFREKF